MTGSNRRSNAGRKAQPQQAKPKPQRTSRVQTPRMTQSSALVPIVNSTANHRAMNNRTTVMSGSDYLGTVSVKGDSSAATDKIRKTFPVSPSAYPGTRLAQLADLWERYRFRKFDIRYVPSVPTTLSSQVMVYQDTDPSDDPSVITDADALIRQATSQAGAQQWNFNQPKRISLASRADRMLYYTGTTKTNERQNLQGKAYFVQVSDALDFNGAQLASEVTCGSLYVDWEAEFQTPQINPTAAARALTDLQPTEFDLTYRSTGDGTVTESAPEIQAGTYSLGLVECSLAYSGDSINASINSVATFRTTTTTMDTYSLTLDLQTGTAIPVAVVGSGVDDAWVITYHFHKVD